jgi:hypothetical protein
VSRQRRRVNLPAPCFNQYNISVLRSAIHSARSDFGRVIARKFERGRFLIIGGVESEKLERQFGELGREAVITDSGVDVATTLPQNELPHFKVAIWFCSAEESDDDRLSKELSRYASYVVLVPDAGANVTKRRSQLVEFFRRLGLLPDYECELGELDTEAVLIRRQPNETAEALIPVVETALARLNTRLSGLERTLREIVRRCPARPFLQYKSFSRTRGFLVRQISSFRRSI